MQVRVYSQGKLYLIEYPEGAIVVRCAARSGPGSGESHDILVVPFRGQELLIPSDPPELLPLLAESRRFGLWLVGEPVPGVDLVGAVCPNCNEDDVSCLSVDGGSNAAHCDNCGREFGLDDRP